MNAQKILDILHVSMEANDDHDFLTKVMDLGQKEAGE